MKVVMVAGRIRTGKEAAANMIKELFHGGNARVVVMSFSDKLGEILNILGLPTDREHMNLLANALKTMPYGQRIFQLIANTAICRAVADKTDLFVLCGARFMEELKIRDVWNAKLVGISASPQVRYQRAKNQAKDGDLSWKEFLALDNAPTEGDIDVLVRLADFKITNEGTLEELRARVAILVKQLEA